MPPWNHVWEEGSEQQAYGEVKVVSQEAVTPV